MRSGRLPTVLLLAALFPAALSPIACRRESDPVRRTLDRIAAAAHDRDAGDIAKNLSAAYRDESGQGRAEAQGTLARLFAAYESVDVEISNVTVERAEAAARARFHATFSGKPRRLGGLDGLFPSRAAYDFEMRLVPEDGDWKIVWASWSQAE